MDQSQREEEKGGEGIIEDATEIVNDQQESLFREQEVNDKVNKDIELRIVEVQIRDGTIGSKYVVYKIKGKDRDGEFEIFRRYSDFDAVRSMLLQRWPGIVIPSIPSKKKVGNMTAQFVKDRMKFLEIFLVRLSELTPLYYSEEFQTFLRSKTSDLEKTLHQQRKHTNEDILQRYNQEYSSLTTKEVTSELSASIINFQMVLIKSLAFFKNYKKIAESVVAAKKKYYESLMFARSKDGFRDKVLVDYEKYCVAEYVAPSEGPKFFHKICEAGTSSKPKKILSSFEYIYDFIRVTEKDIKSFLEAIAQRDKYQANKEKLIEKQRSLGAELQGILSGKTSMKNLIKRKTKEEEVADCQKHIEETKRELEATTQLYDMITKIIGFQEMKLFKEKKLLRYQKVVQKASSNEILQLEQVKKFWIEVQEEPSVHKKCEELGLNNSNQSNQVTQNTTLYD